MSEPSGSAATDPQLVIAKATDQITFTLGDLSSYYGIEVSREAGEEPGTYAIELTSSNPNYSQALVDGQSPVLTITSAQSANGGSTTGGTTTGGAATGGATAGGASSASSDDRTLALAQTGDASGAIFAFVLAASALATLAAFAALRISKRKPRQR